jgi:6-phosphogluconolactonase
MDRSIQIVADADALAHAAALVFIAEAKRAVARNGFFTVVLSGGSTPKALYSLLAHDPDLRLQVPWQQTYFFFGDERHVPPDHVDSNYRTAHETMLAQTFIDSAKVFRMTGEYGDAARAAAEYEEALRNFFQLPADRLPRFDLVMLGMGPDGHTASLFPGTKALREEKRLVTSNWVGKFYTDRITMTAPVLNNAVTIMFMVHGPDKAQALKAVLEGPYEPDQLPAQLISPKNGTVFWLVDKSAAALLHSKTIAAIPRAAIG